MAETGPTDRDRASMVPARPEKMDEGTLKSIIRRELDTSLGVDGGKLSVDRRRALEFYEGQPFGNEVDGRSKVVMLTVLEVVEWVLPALLRIFTASDKIAEYEPIGGGGMDPQRLAMQEEAAKQATQYTSYIWYRDNPGFMLLHDWFKDALVQKLGWIKVYWDTEEVQEANCYTGLSPQEFAALTQGADVEVIEKREYPNPAAAGDFGEDNPDPAQQMLIDCTLRTTRKEGRVRIENVPPEEVLTSRRAKRGTMPFICHRRSRTWTDLLDMGYSPEIIARIQSYDEEEYNSERIARFEQEDDWPYVTERTDQSMREIWIEENYIRVDWDGDGKAELRKITTAGGAREILDNEEIDEVPLIPLTPIPMPHKLYGMSLADIVMDLQLIKSTLVRQMLDNIYLTNNPRHIVAESALTDETYDDLLTSRPGGIIRVKNPEGIVAHETPFVAGAALPLVEFIDQAAEVRTGVSRHNQGLSPDDLNKTATGVNLLQQAAAQRVELIARIFGETGIKEAAKRILGLVTRYQQHERIIRLTGKWVPMDPRRWRNSMDINVSVGLGTGNRDQILAHLMQLLQVQQGIVMQQKGLQGPLVTAPNIYELLQKLQENAGFKEDFFTNPAQSGPQGMQPQQPDPETVKAHSQIAAQQASAQAQLQSDQARAQLEREQMTLKAQVELQVEQAKAEQAMRLEEMKAQHAMQLEQFRARSKAELERATLAHKAAAGAFAPQPANGQ